MGSCKSLKKVNTVSIRTTKPRKISPEAQNLYKRLQETTKKGYAFGHQDATAYGIGWKNDGTLFKTDVHEITGQHPAVHGFDIGHLELEWEYNLDTVPFALIQDQIKKIHQKGGIVTVSWHASNPISGEDSWNRRGKPIKKLLPGRRLHRTYKTWLATIASFFNDIKDDQGRPIPIIFRPFHEMNKPWFWWGKGKCSADEYKMLWRETVDLLTHEFSVDQLLFAYSPDAFDNREAYLEYYPGDDVVDILGMDLYQHWTAKSFSKNLNDGLKVIAQLGKEKQKLYALTESGLEKVRISDWWTKVIDQQLAHSGITWALFWRNARKSHHFVSYPGHKSATDFMHLAQKDYVLFLDDIVPIEVSSEAQ
ncbi:glycoside hydrolase family 26 protein [Flagellimonas meridianipacifica]|nr:glycosyl hydrolase [Allomuricauda pacifica]